MFNLCNMNIEQRKAIYEALIGKQLLTELANTLTGTKGKVTASTIRYHLVLRPEGSGMAELIPKAIELLKAKGITAHIKNLNKALKYKPEAKSVKDLLKRK